MRKIFYISFLFVIQILICDDFTNLQFGDDASFEVVTWNIEHFPKNEQVTINYLKEIIDSLKADIIAVQEIDDSLKFRTMVNELENYNCYIASYGGLGYIYNHKNIQINRIFEIYNTSYYYRPFPRSPLIIDLVHNGENYIVINNHFKCCGDGVLDTSDIWDEEYRRYEAMNLLKSYIDANYSYHKVILVGDLNDEVTDSSRNNVFKNVIDDSLNFKFADMEIAQGNPDNWSYPGWPSHLDHLLITNEVFNDFSSENLLVETIKIDDYLTTGWNSYDYNISDHRPVGIKLSKSLGFEDHISLKSLCLLESYPNPFNPDTKISFKLNEESFVKLSIFNIEGKIVKNLLAEDLKSGLHSVRFRAENLTSGTYIVSLTVNNQSYNNKIIFLK